MYLEHRDRNREGWKFTYKGSDLESYARSKVEHFRSLESRLRFEMSSLLGDKNVSVNSGKMGKLKDALEHAAEQKEMCEVYLFEFHRTPDREFLLSMADVVFFGLAGHQIAGVSTED